MKFWERTEGIPGINSSAMCDELTLTTGSS